MPNLSARYEGMFSEAKASIAAGDYALDHMIDDVNDNRFGISLNLKLSNKICDNILTVQREFNNIEPDQYYYPRADLHITVLAIVSCHAGFTVNDKSIKNYCQIIDSAIQEIPPIEIAFTGITASPSGVLIQGFPLGPDLERFRTEIRTKFKASEVFHTIDSRYRLETAHSTIIRFRKPLRSPLVLVSKIASLRDYSFGTLHADHAELVYGDWYHRAGRTRLLQKLSFINRL